MASPFSVYITARFERDYRSLLKRHPELAADYTAVVSILSTDPHNRTRIQIIGNALWPEFPPPSPSRICGRTPPRR